MALREHIMEKLGIPADGFAAAEARADKDGISIMHAIELMGLAEDEAILDAFAGYFKIQKANLANMEIPRGIIDLIPKDLALSLRVVPIDRAGNNIIIAMGDPRNLQAIDTIRFKAGYFAKPVLASELRITEALEKYYGKMVDFGAVSKDDVNTPTVKASTDNRQAISSRGDKNDGVVIKFVNDILIQCLQRNASDIHIEPYEDFLRIRLRIDGVLHEVARAPLNMKAALISRVKIMSSLDIAETRLPQDGAINIRINDKPVDFRVSTIPGTAGEKIVMRILDKTALNTDLTTLGFEKDQFELFKEAIHRPFGMVLVTGPTGSGKTRTLYSALADLNRESDNIMTAEDPVEFVVEGINQCQMKPDIGLTFATALKAFLRQDPDIIMVGEVRDLETAEIAIKAALTGHLVFSTLHTNSAPETISRLLNMGIEPFNLVSALNLVTAQRLMRKICERCREIDPEVTPEVLITMGIHPSYADKVKAYRGAGCAACGRTGMKGRVAVHEVMMLTDPLREAIVKGLPPMEIKRVAMATGMRTLRQSALSKMVQGITTAQEVISSSNPDVSEGPSKRKKPDAA